MAVYEVCSTTTGEHMRYLCSALARKEFANCHVYVIIDARVLVHRNRNAHPLLLRFITTIEYSTLQNQQTF